MPGLKWLLMGHAAAYPKAQMVCPSICFVISCSMSITSSLASSTLILSIISKSQGALSRLPSSYFRLCVFQIGVGDRPCWGIRTSSQVDEADRRSAALASFTGGGTEAWIREKGEKVALSCERTQNLPTNEVVLRAPKRKKRKKRGERCVEVEAKGKWRGGLSRAREKREREAGLLGVHSECFEPLAV